MEAIKLCRLDTPIIFIEARINLSRFVVTGCAAKTSATVTFPSLNLISLFAFCEALKPAIEACGISTLSQSPMLGFHKQMDNRIKLLEEILSFRMQGVEFDNGDMYVDGHKAASDVRDEFVSVTEKLMDE